MPYDPEKYREKREKVLGKRKRGIPFQTMAVVFTFAILSGFAFLVLPKVIASFQERNLDDAIYRLRDERPWPAAVGPEIATLSGVDCVVLDREDTRLIVTFDRSKTDLPALDDLFRAKGLEAVLLNRMPHGARAELMKEEAEK